MIKPNTKEYLTSSLFYGLMTKTHKIEGGNMVNKRQCSQGYIWLRRDNHPYAKNGFVKEERLVLERDLGRYILPTEVVHHKNGIKSDNRLSNLLLFKGNSEHIKHHQQERIKAGIPLITDAGRKKLSESRIGKRLSKETKERISKSKKGTIASDETKKKMSLMRMGKSNTFYGKTHTEEVRKRIADARKGKTHSEETKRKMSEANCLAWKRRKNGYSS